MTLNVFMKSGNVINLDQVEEYNVKGLSIQQSEGVNTKFIQIAQKKTAKRRLLAPTLILSQVEAIVEEK